MVKFNKPSMLPKPKKATKGASHSSSVVKPNKPKVVYEKSFLQARYISVLSLILLGLIALVSQAAYVQIVNADSLIDEADKRSLRKQEIQFVRGSILDRNGQVLSVRAKLDSVKPRPNMYDVEYALKD